MKNLKKILVIDVEATCWESGVPPKGQCKEIIQIGICPIDLHSGKLSQVGLEKALFECDIIWSGIPHRADDDAYNAAALLTKILRVGLV